MAWIYLAESAESVWPYHHGPEQLPTVKVTDMHKLFSCPECNQENSKSPPYGMTLEQSQGKCCLPSILFSEASLARTSALQEMELAWKESEAVYSTKLSGLQKKLERRLSSSKMCQQLELVDFEKLSEHLPIFGMTVGGRVFLPQNLEPHILEKDGSYLPTPVADDSGYRKQKYQQGGTALSTKVGGQLNPVWVEWLMGYQPGWTELKDWAMQWFRSKPKQLSKD